MGLAIFDICDTLYATNTTTEFLRFLGDEGNRDAAKAVDRWTSRSHPLFWVGAVSHRLFGKDLARRQMVRSLKGMSDADIRDAADRYVASSLAALRNMSIFERLDQHQKAGDRIFLASNSLEPVVQSIATMIGAQGAGSRLDFRDGICTGTLATDLTGAKSQALATLLGDTRPPITVYTDNFSDTDLIALADHAVIVIPRGNPFRRWAGNAHEYVQL